MRRRLLIIVSIFCALSATAQNMKSVFVSMPDSIAPLLTQTNKEDCIDFLDSNMKAVVKNRFGNEAEMKALTENYVLMQTSPVGTLEMKLLPVNDSTNVVCMVKTVCASACDSEVHFYTSDWSKKLDAKNFLQTPEADAFFLPNDTLTDEDALIRKKADMHLMKVSLSQDDASLTYIYSTPDYLNEEDREKLLPHLRKEPIVLRWQDGKFR
ncbi:MAG: DUF3256 family protein [Bacteroidaceae bacterium]|nr:DUF3256 family protein [Bacteroidaceae bacterium]